MYLIEVCDWFHPFMIFALFVAHIHVMLHKGYENYCDVLRIFYVNTMLVLRQLWCYLVKFVVLF